jgi:hypothetical protein
MVEIWGIIICFYIDSVECRHHFHGLYEAPSPSGLSDNLLVNVDLSNRNSFTFILVEHMGGGGWIVNNVSGQFVWL